MKFLILFTIILLRINSATAQDMDTTIQKERIVFHQWDLETNDLAVFLVDGVNGKLVHILVNGNFKKIENDLVFIPQFPLLQNISYVLKTKNHEIPFSLKAKNYSSPTVTAIYPTANELPENLLRMYIQFSQPMKTKGNIEKIKLLNEQGIEVKGAIFNNVYELWDDSQTQLTIIFDPSRVKTGLIANETLGRSLKPNKIFKIIIVDLENVYGKKLLQSYVKTFSVTKADVTSPDTESWRFKLPKSDSKTPLSINFKSSIDKMSLQHRIQLLNENDKVIKGVIFLKNKEKIWEFIPQELWTAGKYTLKVNSRLADPSGNNLNGLFDHDIGGLKNKQEGQIVQIPIIIK
tara:strand:- start:1817 stop:2860 length:1044 start_codon:yes stop_codon:yes gene_type:complete